jgi:hypothetical protein
LVERGRELRRKQTPAETILWETLRDRQFENLKFRRQHQAGDYLVDFFCHEHSLVVEADGDIHDAGYQIKHDKKRDACASFGFVFVHPFLDGNGRLHRFLLHHLLRLGGFTPLRAVVPVSAAMEHDIARYAEVLKHYSAPRTAMLDYRLDSDANFIDVKTRPLHHYAFFDATELCEFTFACLERAIDHDLADELAYLRAYDSAHRSLTRWLDAPQPELEKLIRYIAQNNGRLSKNKRGQFPLIGDDDITRAETQVGEAFTAYWKRLHPIEASDTPSRTV